MTAEIRAKIRKTKEALKSIGYIAANVSPGEFYDYMTGEIFSEDTTTLRDVLGNQFLMVHELAEISELKKMGRAIDKRVIMESPKTTIYEAHFIAMDLELKYALYEEDYFWIKVRLKQHKESVLKDDSNLPETLRPRGEGIFRKFMAILNKKNDAKQ